MNQILNATGYLAVFVPLLVMVAGHILGFEWGPVVMFFGVFVVIRLLTGDKSIEQPEWSELLSKMLDRLPVLYTVCFLGMYAWVLGALMHSVPISLGDKVGFVLGLVVTWGMGSCVAHELVHRRSRGLQRLGSLLLALAGYPFFASEHLAHHAMPRNVEQAHCPKVTESIWSYALRRFILTPKEALDWSMGIQARSKNASWIDTVWFWCAVSSGSFAAMVAAGGVFGGVVFLCLAVGVPTLMNFVVYMQHWGLGLDNGTGGSMRDQLGWEDGCRFQYWVTLGVSFHNRHHEKQSIPYYRLKKSQGAPLLPGGYAIMLLIALVPPLWRKVMVPRLNGWISDPMSQQGAGRSMYCFKMPAVSKPVAGKD